MSGTLHQRLGRNVAGARHRRQPIGAHEGSHRDLLRRHVAECIGHCHHYDERQRLHAETFRLLTDERILMAAMDRLMAHGLKAPGPNGIRLADLDLTQRWDLARQLRQSLRSGRYYPGPTRQFRIPKGGGRPGTRPIEIPNIEDQIVQCAIVLVLQPLFDPTFAERSFGFRPHRGREDALATVQQLCHDHGFQVIVTADLENAFTTVPHGRLWDVLGRHGIQDRTLDLIRRCIRNNESRGLPQGGCLSPLLLNAYLDHFLDRPWNRRMQNTPLIRYADDLCALCESTQEAERVYPVFAELLRPTGTRLKTSLGSPIHDLSIPGATVQWLGYQLTAVDGQITAEVGEESWTCLEEQLELAHQRPDSAVVAYRINRGWVDQLGPCLSPEDLRESYHRMLETAQRYAFEEIPSLRSLLRTLERAASRYAETRRIVRHLSYGRVADGSAHLHPQVAQIGHLDRASIDNHTIGSGATALPAAVARIWTDGACIPGGNGGWAFIVEEDGANRVNTACRWAVAATSNNRMELTAVIEALRWLPNRRLVQIHTDSRYVERGINTGIRNWRNRRWRHRDGGHIKNLDLWLQLDELLAHREVQCIWVRGHAGSPLNEECDRLANLAACEGQSPFMVLTSPSNDNS